MNNTPARDSRFSLVFCIKRSFVLLFAIIFACLCGCGNSSNYSSNEDTEEYSDEEWEFENNYEEPEISNVKMLTEILDLAYKHGYMSGYGHDWLLDVYRENEGYGYYKYDLEFYGDEEDAVFYEINRVNDTEKEPQVRTDELFLNILDLAYYHGYISAYGHDWLLDAYRDNEGYGYRKYDLEFYGDEEDTLFFYGMQEPEQEEYARESVISKVSINWISSPQSSCFSQIGYDSRNNTLAVTFRDTGKTYYYYAFSLSDWNSFVAAESLGSYYNENIKGFFDYELAG